MPACRVAFALVVAVLGTACSTVHVNTHPAKAHVEANGENITATHEFSERPGFKAHEIKVRKKGYKPVTVFAPRDELVGWLRWVSVGVALPLAFVLGGSGCCVTMLFCNRALVPSLLGAMLGVVLSLSSPEGALFGTVVTNTVAPDCLSIPAMALGTLLCGGPAAGLMALPLIYPHARDVDVRLEKDDAAPAAPPKDAGDGEG